MTDIRSAMIHGTGYTAGDLIDEAVAAAGGGGGSPKAGEPTRFLTLTYRHPGNEDGTSVSATTGIVIPNSTIAPGTSWFVTTITAYARTTDRSHEAITENTIIYFGRGLTGNLGPQPNVPGDADLYASFTGIETFFSNDPQFHIAVTAVAASNDIRAFIHGMSTNTPTDWTINVQLAPFTS